MLIHIKRILWICFLGLSVPVFGQDAYINIMPDGDKQTKALDSSGVFTCMVVGLDSNINPKLTWYGTNGNPILDTNGKIYIESENNGHHLKLYFVQIQQEDAGRYECKGTLNGKEESNMFELMLYKIITFDHAPSPQHPAINTDALIECRVSGQPVPTVSWRYRGQKLESGGRYSSNHEGLRISAITQADNGIYTCRAEVPSSGHMDDVDIDVTVHIPPTMTKDLGNQKGVEDQEFSLTCKAEGLPDPKYEFYKGNSQAPMFSQDRIEVDGNAGVINFRPLKREDKDQYRCEAINDVGSVSSMGEVTVVVPPRIVSLDNTTEKEGNSGRLLCVSEGQPPPLMTFMNSKTQEKYVTGESNDGGRIKVAIVSDGQLELIINNLSPPDTSNYTCEASNEGGMFQRNGTVTVHYQPRFDPNHPRLVYSWSGKTRNMTCEPQGEPAPTVQWYRWGNVLIMVNESFQIYTVGRQSILQITVREGDQNWIYGGYECRATNNYGTQSLEIKLEIATVPDKPKSVTVKDHSPTTVVFTIVAPDDDGGVPVYGYRVEYENIVQDFNPNEDLVVENLKAATSYVFRFRAKNEVGVGQYSELTHRTDPMRAPYPIEIESNPEGSYSTSYVLRWKIPKTGGLPIKEYIFEYQKVEVHEGTWKIKKVLEDPIKYEVLDDPKDPMLFYTYEFLTPGTYYSTQVVARNDIGSSTPNPDFVFRTAEDPTYRPVEGNTSSLSIASKTSVILCVLLANFLRASL